MLQYQENGHVTLPDVNPQKPANGGIVYVYGTSQPQANDSLLSIHKVWDNSGTGRDGRGTLIGAFNFDDGRCYQVNEGAISKARQRYFGHVADSVMGADLWCQNVVSLPKQLELNTLYTLYWVWDWPSRSDPKTGAKAKPKVYTTCIDIEVVTRR